MRHVVLKKVQLTMTRRTKTKTETFKYVIDKSPVVYVDGDLEPLVTTIDVVNIFTKKKWTKDQFKNYHCSLNIID